MQKLERSETLAKIQLCGKTTTAEVATLPVCSPLITPTSTTSHRGTRNIRNRQQGSILARHNNIMHNTSLHTTNGYYKIILLWIIIAIMAVLYIMVSYII